MGGGASGAGWHSAGVLLTQGECHNLGLESPHLEDGSVGGDAGVQHSWSSDPDSEGGANRQCPWVGAALRLSAPQPSRLGDPALAALAQLRRDTADKGARVPQSRVQLV